MDIEFLGEIPLHVDIRKTSDEGRPIAVSDAASANAQPFFNIAKRVLEKLNEEQVEQPSIIIE